MNDHLSIGVDIGGTHMRTALVDARGKMIKHQKILTGISAGAKHTSLRLVEECRRLMAEAAGHGAQVRAIGLGVAGKIDPVSGLVLFSPNLPAMRDYPLAAELARETGLSVYMENDANLFGLGEQWLGAGRGIRNWIGITLGTGVGGCLILSGKLWTGDGLGFSGEIGHTNVNPDGPLCLCGLRGCLETYSSGRALVEGVKTRIAEKDLISGHLFELFQADELKPEDIYRSALRMEETVTHLFERMGWALGLALANLFTSLGIRHAVIGGGVSASWDLFIAPLMKSLAERCCMLNEHQMVVQRGWLGDNAALLGAARLVQISEAVLQ